MKTIIDKAVKTNTLTKNEITELLLNNGSLLYTAADKIREKTKGNAIHLRGLIEFTNICARNCFYCGLRRDNNKVERYRFTTEEIIECAKYAKESGFKTIVLQGGEDAFFDADKMINIIKKIKELDVALTLSLGEKTYDEYKAYKQAGADRYLIRIETTDETLYKNLHPNMDFNNRMNCLYNLKSLGYETGTGCLVGLPNQTVESLASDILFFKEIDADMIGIGPFIPHPNTPLADANKNNFKLSLKVMAITRILMPDINIPATTAMETLSPNGRIIVLQSGANVVMPNITYNKYRSKYEIYPGKTSMNNSSDKDIECIRNKIMSIGRTISITKGFRKD